MNSALQLIEIVECILKHVGLELISGPGYTYEFERLRGLKHCLTVNKLWFYESARLIWKSIEFSKLNDIGDLERQQVYANFVTELHSDRFLPPSLTIPSQLKFPVLQSVNFIDPNFFEESLYPLLVPSLSRLTLFKIDASDQFLLDVIERCPDIDDLTLHGLPKLTTAGLQKFLATTRCSRLSLSHMSECLGWEALCKAAENTFIKHLLIGCDEYAFSQVRKLVRHPFPSLTWLSCVTSFEGSIEDILCMTKTLKSVALEVHDFNNVIRFQKRPECSIENFTITAESGYLDKRGLIELAKYSNLKSVWIEVKEPLTVPTQVVHDNWVDDKWIDEFTRLTPSLDSFMLEGIPINVTSRGISAIGRNCPDILDLELWGEKADYVSVEKSDFSPDLPCLFPKLENMGVAYLCFSKGGMSHEEILWHFPLVVDFTEEDI